MNSLRSAFTSLADRILQQTKEQKNPNDDTLKKIHDEVRELKDQFALMSQENLKLTKQNEDLEQTNKQLRGELEKSQHALDALKRAQNEKKLEPKLLLVDQTTQVGPEDLPKNNTLISDEDGFEVVNVEELADKSLGTPLTFLRAEVLTGSDSANLPEVPNNKVETPQTIWEDAIATLLLNAKRTSEWRHSSKALPDQPTYTFRANIVDLADDSRRLVSVRSPLPTMVCSELLARLVAEGALSEGEAAASTVALASSGLVAEASQALPHTSQVAIYLPGEAAGATKVRVSVAGREFCFVLDARVSQVMGVLASELPEVRGAAVWWSGVDISDEVFSEARLGHLCSAEGVWSHPMTSALLQNLTADTAEQGVEEQTGQAQCELPMDGDEAVDFFSETQEDNAEPDAADFFTENVEDDQNEEPRQENESEIVPFQNEQQTNLSIAEQNNPVFVSECPIITLVLDQQPVLTPVVVQSPDLQFNLELELNLPVAKGQTIDLANERVSQSVLRFLCLFFSMPPALVAPCIRAGDEPLEGTITVAVRPPSEESAAYLEVFACPVHAFQMTLFEHFVLGDTTSENDKSNNTGLSLSKASIPVQFFTEASNPLVPLSSENLSICRRLLTLAASAGSKSGFNTKKEEEQNEEFSSDIYFHIFLATVAATRLGMPLMTTAIPYVHGKKTENLQ